MENDAPAALRNGVGTSATTPRNIPNPTVPFLHVRVPPLVWPVCRIGFAGHFLSQGNANVFSLFGFQDIMYSLEETGVLLKDLFRSLQ